MRAACPCHHSLKYSSIASNTRSSLRSHYSRYLKVLQSYTYTPCTPDLPAHLISSVSWKLSIDRMADIASSKWLTAGLLIIRTTAYAYVQGIVADDVYYPGYQPSAQYQNSSLAAWTAPLDINNPFVTNYTSPDIICNLDATPGQTYASVEAGSTIELEWTPWSDALLGPVLTYLANCNGECTTVDKNILLFNKIDEAGLVQSPQTQVWAIDELKANNNTWTLSIPASIAPGDYVLRHEIIALRNANVSSGARNYPQCFNLRVTGAGNDSLPSGVPGTQLYSAQQVGLTVDALEPLTNYTIPGPPLYAGVPQNALMSANLLNTTLATFADPTTIPACTSAVSTVTVTSTMTSVLAVQSQTNNVSSGIVSAANSILTSTATVTSFVTVPMSPDAFTTVALTQDQVNGSSTTTSASNTLLSIAQVGNYTMTVTVTQFSAVAAVTTTSQSIQSSSSITFTEDTGSSTSASSTSTTSTTASSSSFAGVASYSPSLSSVYSSSTTSTNTAPTTSADPTSSSTTTYAIALTSTTSTGVPVPSISFVSSALTTSVASASTPVSFTTYRSSSLIASTNTVAVASIGSVTSSTTSTMETSQTTTTTGTTSSITTSSSYTSQTTSTMSTLLTLQGITTTSSSSMTLSTSVPTTTTTSTASTGYVTVASVILNPASTASATYAGRAVAIDNGYAPRRRSGTLLQRWN